MIPTIVHLSLHGFSIFHIFYLHMIYKYNLIYKVSKSIKEMKPTVEFIESYILLKNKIDMFRHILHESSSIKKGIWKVSVLLRII